MRESRPVAQTEFLYKKEKNPYDDNDRNNRLLLLKDTNILKKTRLDQLEFLSFFENILTSKAKVNVYSYFLEHGATTVRELGKNNKGRGSQTYFYKIINSLMDADLVKPYHKIKSGQTSGGKPATVYGLVDASPEEVRDATSRYMRSMSHIYVFVDQLYQRTLYEVKNEEIQYRKIVEICRHNVSRGFHFIDVADEITYRLNSEGVKVWR